MLACSMLLALSWGGRVYAWSSPIVMGYSGNLRLMACSSCGLSIERRNQSFRPRFSPFRRDSNDLATVLTSAGMYGTLLFVPLFIQAVLGTGAMQSGAVLHP